MRFFDDILEARPNIFSTYNGDSFDWLELPAKFFRLSNESIIYLQFTSKFSLQYIYYSVLLSYRCAGVEYCKIIYIRLFIYIYINNVHNKLRIIKFHGK